MKPKTPKQPSQPSQPSSPPTTDLTPHDLYFVCLHLANLIITCEDHHVDPKILDRLQRCLGTVVAEYAEAVDAAKHLKAVFDAD